MTRGAIRVAMALAIGIAGATPAAALPTMIRIGYTNCAACHVAPQGGGVLTEYGQGIDQAQSLRGGELQRVQELHRRLIQDLRVVMQEQSTWTDRPMPNNFRPRLLYRNVTNLGAGFRLSGVATIEGASAPRPAKSYDPAAGGSTLFVNSALVSYRPTKTLEFDAGRDQLPSGVNVPSLGAYIKSRNRLGYYDAPTQLKMAWWGKRHQVMPYVYAPGGNEASGERESGAGTLAEFDLLGNQRTVVGASFLKGTARNGDRQMVGGYARLGFGRWGILAEHDVTDRTRTALAQSFTQNASFTQVFWAAREWLVLSGIGERLRVERPFLERRNAGQVELSARLAPQATIVLGTRLEKDLVTNRLAKSLILQMAFKTVY
ncbi:MAG TPA: hypothetical protein VN716_13365 [Vicinamibacterales bacterium]|jgi:hypothetical protein|nr:hypothetical protein [Vicinamibacterales bacterium]